ncbi:ATP-dependent Clp protease adapter ClpS [Leptospira kemamanensis]|uniref:ATP-dependent Clp protease adapter protein ClpS n=1 Tax=Leptospira kemamanensis TaxID=2484942 RepID=A0A4R9JUM6_9LEPT|nr:ATP-dependent Clp protease adapter ClpS [Leptospira kemamanensis]TGL54942.1 ATP-dependent Clp protease adapter ClpS [Leptospira kemamanensis]
MSETKRKSYTDFNVELLEKEKQKKQVKKPNRYQVILINDDYTPQEFVVYVLAIVFRKSMEESRQIMWKAHTEGSAVCGVYSLDIARTKVEDVHRLADDAGHPLQCQLAKEE